MPLNDSDKRFFDLLAQNPDKDKNATLENMRADIKVFEPFVDEPADIDFEDHFIVAKAGHQIRLRYYSVDAQTKPLIIYFPGNAFIFDCFEINHTIISKIAKIAECNAVMVECRLSPEHPYPAPLEDGMEAVEYILNHLDFFHVDKSKIIMSGYSSGANLAAVLTNRLRVKKGAIFHQFLISGGYDYTDSLHDFDEYALQDKMLDPDICTL
ncbi:MAG: alpha/beta hydrolase fold domain-containing protein [Legionellales bacterium]|nr:alpha/beta hydrolase fold domain-containing protein [Legionellales bacterium]